MLMKNVVIFGSLSDVELVLFNKTICDIVFTEDCLSYFDISRRSCNTGM